MDPLVTSVGVVALVVGIAIGWLIGRSRSTTIIAELNANLVLARRLTKQLGETGGLDPVRSFKAPELTPAAEPAGESTVAAG
jgi:hypothetical protein